MPLDLRVRESVHPGAFLWGSLFGLVTRGVSPFCFEASEATVMILAWSDDRSPITGSVPGYRLALISAGPRRRSSVHCWLHSARGHLADLPVSLRPEKRAIRSLLPNLHVKQQSFLQLPGITLNPGTGISGKDRGVTGQPAPWRALAVLLDAVLDSGGCGTESAAMIDFSGGEAEIVRRGAGNALRFE